MEPTPTAQVLHSGILDQLGQEIVAGQLPAGSALTLAAIEDRFGISRTVAREVMRSLEACGLTESRRRVGIVVLSQDRWQALDPLVVQWQLQGPRRDQQLRFLTELRTGIEPVAAAAAAQHASELQRARLLELAATLAGETHSTANFHTADIEFHTLLLKASGNSMFAALTKILQVSLTSRVSHGQFPPTPRKQAIDAHVAVAQAVAAGNADLAFQNMVTMLATLRADLFSSTNSTPKKAES